MDPTETTISSLEVIKRGETSLTVTLIRSAGGLTVYAKAHPMVEAFIQGLGTGETVDVKASGPYWRSVGLDKDKPLLIHRLAEPIPNIALSNGDVVTICRPGQPLLCNTEPGHSPNTSAVNLSFLRLVGISEGAGVAFSVRGVHTLEALNHIHKLIGEGYRTFYKEYLKPVKLDVVCSTQVTML